MKNLLKRFGPFLILVLVVLNITVLLVLFIQPHGKLKVSFLNIGQGDAILIEGPTGIQMLVDGGPDRRALRELPKVMGVLDRSIDIVVETHPDRDHIGGLASVFERYTVSHFLEPNIPNDTGAAAALLQAVETEPYLTRAVARRGMRIHLGGDAYADILYPDRDVSGVETNTGSIIMRVVYGETSFMLSGDAPSAIEDWVVTLDGGKGGLTSDVLKAGHHGSKSSTDELWLTTVDPRMVVISAGKGNSYGHPAPEVISRIQKQGAEILSTIEEGTITFVSDGKTLVQR